MMNDEREMMRLDVFIHHSSLGAGVAPSALQHVLLDSRFHALTDVAITFRAFGACLRRTP
jgi:hypothetical protein